jgi:hypothetical protein
MIQIIHMDDACACVLCPDDPPRCHTGSTEGTSGVQRENRGCRRAGITLEEVLAREGKKSVMSRVSRDTAWPGHATVAAVEAPELAQSVDAAAESLAALIHRLADRPIVPKSRFYAVLIEKLGHWREVVERPAGSGAEKAEDLQEVAKELQSLIALLPDLKDDLLPDA